MLDYDMVIATKIFYKGNAMKIKYVIVALMLFNVIKLFSMEFEEGNYKGEVLATASISPHLNYPQCLIDLVVHLVPLGPNCDAACQELIKVNPSHMNQRIHFASGSFTQHEKEGMRLCVL